MPKTGAQKILPRYLQRRVRDFLTYVLLLLAFLGVIVGLYKGGVHLSELKPDDITISELPSAVALSWLRMFLSYVASICFAFGLGLAAARFPLGERIIIPMLDILQSVPVTGFFPAAIAFFVALGRGERFGVELAAVFLIFTSQAWNLAFAVYEATKTIPEDHKDAVASLGVKGSAGFWKLYAPACVPRLVYNSILSWSNGWFFLVACEIISVGHLHFNLPGIGSFLQRASEQNQPHLIFWGLGALITVILLMDLLIWRPLSYWAERFKSDTGTAGYIRRPVRFKLRYIKHAIVLAIFPVTALFRKILLPLFWDLPVTAIGHLIERVYAKVSQKAPHELNVKWHLLLDRLQKFRLVVFWAIGVGLGFVAGKFIYQWFQEPWPTVAQKIPLALLYSTGRLILALITSFSVVFVILLLVWDRPRSRRALTTIAQVGASIPAAALFPLIMTLLVRKYHFGLEVASIILLLSGMFWYVLFNGLGGIAIIPDDLTQVSRSMGLSRYQMFKKLVIPAIQPALITGAITAWGGGWNALVVSEYIHFQGKTLTVEGLGSLLNYSVIELADARAITVCIFAMVIWVILINTVVWRPLYQGASEKYKLDGSS